MKSCWKLQRPDLPSRSQTRSSARNRADPNFRACLRRVESEVRIALGGQAPTQAAEPVELLDLGRGQSLDVRIANREFMERHSVPESHRHEDTNRPFVDGAKQVYVPHEERTEVGRDAPGYQVEEHVTPVLFRDADWELVREVADGFLPAFPNLSFG